MMDARGAITESLLIITGSMGAGKSSVLAEVSDLLASRCIVHAALDLDALGLAHLPTGNDGLMYRNLESLCKNYASAGVSRILLARAIENRSDLELVRSAVAAAHTVICRLSASIAVMEHRVKTRESGVYQQKFIARVAELNAILDDAQLEDFNIFNENRPLIEVAREMLVKAAWILG